LEFNCALGDFTALGLEQVGDSLQRCRLARSIGAEQRDDAASRHIERHALEHQDHVIVDHLNVLHA
jgi:hypothetical protein